MEVPPPTPGGTPQGWAWPGGAWLYLDIDADPLLPGLHALSGVAHAQCAVVAGRPMCLKRRDADESEAGVGFGGWVQGFLGDQLRFFAQVGAPSAAERDGLLCALLTITPDAAAGSPTDPVAPAGG
ncbi:MAG TPA: hypothetical protein VEZ47_12555 [Gemmatirosa sp.]|nr:hypothetical protein [Gemmatirosa sp.]